VTPNEALVALSKWIDASNAHRHGEAILWGRVSKIGEEFGETVQALIGATGQNPRKGTTHSFSDVLDELLDVAVTALGAYEHISGHDGIALHKLNAKIVQVAVRSGSVPHDAKCFQSKGVPDDMPSDLCDCGTLAMIRSFSKGTI